MIYVYDTSSFRALQHFYPKIFKTIWQNLDEMVSSGELISTKEVFTELNNQNVSQEILDWAKLNKSIFQTPQPNELSFVAQIFQVSHFQALISKQAALRGTPVADPFVIACAKIHNAVVVTEEQFKPNAAKIPNVCQHFGINCINLAKFMEEQNWTF